MTAHSTPDDPPQFHYRYHSSSEVTLTEEILKICLTIYLVPPWADTSSHLTLMKLWGRCYHFPFTVKEAETPRGQLPFSLGPSQEMNPGPWDPEAHDGFQRNLELLQCKTFISSDLHSFKAVKVSVETWWLCYMNTCNIQKGKAIKKTNYWIGLIGT